MKKTLIALMALAGVAMADSIGYNSMTESQKEGVVLAWDFSSGSGSTVAGSGVTNNFVLNEDGYAVINGNGCPWTNSLTSSFANGNFTLSFDVNGFKANNWQTLVALYSVGGHGDGKSLQIGVTPTGELSLFNEVGGAAGFASIDTAGNLGTGLFSGFTGASTITIVSDMTDTKTLSLYVDGEFTASHANWTASTNQALMGLQIGATFGGGRGFPEATISDITLWNKALSTSEIQGLMVVPEPTTATLSLLALAGLAARRRRK